MSEVKDKIRRLERDLDNAMEVSNRCISDRWGSFVFFKKVLRAVKE